MADEEEIVVNVEGEQPGGDDVVVHQDDAVAVLKAQFAELEADNKKRKDAEEAASRRAADADRRAADAAARASAAETRVAESESGAIESGIAAANSLAAQAKADYKVALEKGDFDAAADAQERLADAVADRKRLNEAKADLEVRKSRTDEAFPPRPQSDGDPFEQHLTKFTPRTADWMRGHRDWVTDPRKSAKLTGAHHMAVGDGLTPDTDEYFEHVEKTLGLREQPPARSGNGSGNGQGRQQQRRGAPPVAPVNGSAGGHSSGSGDSSKNEVWLTKGERDRANDGTLVWNPGNRHPKTGQPIQHGDPLVGRPIGNQEMARRKLYGQREGLYDKNAMEA